MPVKKIAHKKQMAKKKSTNTLTSWVPSEFKQSDLTKAQRDGFLVGGDQVVFPSTERIPKPPSGYRVMFLAFLLHGLSLHATNFSAGFSLCTACSFISSRQILSCISLVLLCFASLSWGNNPIGFSRNFFSAFALVSLYQRALSWAGLLCLSALRHII
jgi:hypothetical protein